MKLYPHQQTALNETEQFNRVAYYDIERKEIKGYEGLYEVDNIGNVYSLIYHGRKLKLTPFVKNGYLAVRLSKEGKCKHKYVHRLVAENFIQNPNGYKEVNHLDCDKTNNEFVNLEWCDRKHNLQHSYEHGLKRKGEKHGMHRLTQKEVNLIRSLINDFPQKEIAERFGISQCTVSAIKCGRIWKEGD